MEHLQLPMGFVAGVRRLPGNGPTRAAISTSMWQDHPWTHRTGSRAPLGPRSCPGRLDGFTHEPHLPTPTWTGWTTSPPALCPVPEMHASGDTKPPPTSTPPTPHSQDLVGDTTRLSVPPLAL
ncbi:hypothetical protein CPLU01_14320 [Colletotrichum plurivorum]|uniref:Uncharacterized protein n=1 Tax=Colletotrichum plurivorum TaxID=2175906 RepID=A0A8H6JKF3_9PEZI|nr:hypothetical protein CPLU01_14320 [Colletotrichum plurivorum]